LHRHDLLLTPAGRIFCHYRANATSGSKTVTFDPAGASADLHAVVIEISGAAAASPLDVTATANGIANDAR
jgi:hypothetical protein